MSSTTIFCTDGSDLALKAASTGLALLRPSDTTLVVTVVEPVDVAVGGEVSGFAGSGLSAEEIDRGRAALLDDGRAVVERAAAALGIDGAVPQVLEGDPGPVLCALAEEVGASAIVMGSRGRGGFKRAFLGSVSDHVVRNAPCPVVITNAGQD
jgi:nucleotide-binding universal stress UspA family protein